MLDDRMVLKTRLEMLSPTTKRYYQAPPSEGMEYPCFLYAPKSGVTLEADDRPYRFFPTFDLTIITKDPDDPLVKLVANNLIGCRFDRYWVVDNLHHTNFVVG